MKVFLFEYFSACDTVAPEFAEGQAMLKTLVNSFLKTGHRVSTIAHTRGAASEHQNSSIIKNPGWGADTAQFNRLFYDTLADCDSALIIAPEVGGILGELTSRVEESGVTNLGPTSAGIAKAQDKFLTFQTLSGQGIPTPDTRIVSDFAKITDIAEQVGYPLVVKPIDGVGSRGVCRVDNPVELQKAASEAMRAFGGKNMILLQEYIPGRHLSVTIIGGTTACPISLNEQTFAGCKPFNYIGGTACIDHPDIRNIFKTASLAWDALGGLQGFGGIDLVVAENDVYVIEINPRPTTPLVALEKCLSGNPAELLLQALRGEGITPIFKQRSLPFRVT